VVRFTLFATLLAVGCSTDRPTSEPWFTEVVPTDITVVGARYDADGTLHVLGYSQAGTIHYGQWDDDARGLDWSDAMTFELDGAAWAPEAGSLLSASRLDLAVQPDTDDVWVWIDGYAGSIDTSGTQVTFSAAFPPHDAVDRRPAEGGLVFLEQDRLLMSQGDNTIQQTMAIVPTNDLNSSPEAFLINGQDFPPFCAADVGGGMIHATLCDGRRFVFDLTTQEQIGFTGGDEDEDVSHPSLMSGVADEWIVGEGLEPAACVGLRSPDGRALQDSGKYRSEGTCYGMDAPLGRVQGGDIREDGDQFAVHYANGLFLVLDRNAPSNRERDLTGDWCSGNASFSLAETGSFGPPDNYRTDRDLFNDITWRRRGEALRIDYRGLTPANFAWEGDVHVEHWARRTGDTLTVKTYTHEKFETDGAGLSQLTGVYVLCP